MGKQPCMMILGLAILFTTGGAIYDVSDQGTWSKTWPQELEPLRAQARTLSGPDAVSEHHAITFKDRAQFEAAWPHLLKVKTSGTPLLLTKGPSFFLGDDVQAGVIVHAPDPNQPRHPDIPEAPIEGVKEPRMKWMNTTYIELVVDGELVDLNRLPLPEETPIIDQRFKQE